MDWEFIITTFIVPAVFAIWILYKERDKFKRDRYLDQDEHLQQSQSDSLKQVLSLNEKLIEHLVQMSNGRFASIDTAINQVSERQNQLNHILAEIKTQQGYIGQDWARMEEVVSDIDVMLHEMKEALYQHGIRTTRKRDDKKATQNLE